MKLKALKRTAYHEAGHTVAAFYLRLPIYGVTIKPDKHAGSLGHTRHYNPLRRTSEEDLYAVTPKAKDRLERLIVVNLAGGLAEQKYDLRGYRRAQSGEDHHAAVDCALRLTGGDTEGASLLLPYFTYRARNLVRVRWGQIEAVAAALLEHESLKPGQVRAVINAYIEAQIETRRRGIK